MNPDRPETFVPLSELSAALDEVFALRRVLAYEAGNVSASLGLRSFPKSRRPMAEDSIKRMRAAARGEVRPAYGDVLSQAFNSAMRAAGAPETLTRSAFAAERNPDRKPRRKYWVSWYSTRQMGAWTFESPWWISGERMSDGAVTVCAAVIAENEAAAMETIYLVYDRRPKEIEFRYVTEQSDDWSPFSDRFPRGDWMEWPL